MGPIGHNNPIVKPIVVFLFAVCLAMTGFARTGIDRIVAFSYRATNGSLPPPHYKGWDLDGKVGRSSVEITLKSISGGKRSTWTGTLEGAAFRRFLAVLNATEFEAPAEGPPMVGGPVDRVTLSYEDDEGKYEGKPTNRLHWRKLLAEIEAIIAAGKKAAG